MHALVESGSITKYFKYPKGFTLGDFEEIIDNPWNKDTQAINLNPLGKIKPLSLKVFVNLMIIKNYLLLICLLTNMSLVIIIITKQNLKENSC